MGGRVPQLLAEDVRALLAEHGTMTAAARAAGVTRVSLYAALRREGLPTRARRRPTPADLAVGVDPHEARLPLPAAPTSAPRVVVAASRLVDLDTAVGAAAEAVRRGDLQAADRALRLARASTGYLRAIL